MADFFDEGFDFVIGNEAGYVNDPDDPGGETKYGISKRSYPREDIKGMTLERAKEIYRRDFWDKMGCGGVNNKRLAIRLFDLGVNCGSGTGVRLLQRAMNLFGAGLVEDGKLGPVTLNAVNGFRHQVALYEALKYCAADRYVGLRKSKYLAGWLNRLGKDI